MGVFLETLKKKKEKKRGSAFFGQAPVVNWVSSMKTGLSNIQFMHVNHLH